MRQRAGTLPRACRPIEAARAGGRRGARTALRSAPSAIRSMCCCAAALSSSACRAIAGCSAIAVGRRAGALVAQNWDAPPVVRAGARAVSAFRAGWIRAGDHRVLWRAVLGRLQSSRPRLRQQRPPCCVHRAGPAEPGRPPAYPGERSVTAALDLLRRCRTWRGRSYLLGDASGAVAGVEVAARFGVRVNQGGSPVLHTNHALDPDIAADEYAAELQATYPSSRHRLRCAAAQASGAARCRRHRVAAGGRGRLSGLDLEGRLAGGAVRHACSRSSSNAAQGRCCCVRARPAITPISVSHGKS